MLHDFAIAAMQLHLDLLQIDTITLDMLASSDFMQFPYVH